MPSPDSWTKRLKPFLVVSIGIGVAGDLPFLFNLGLLTSEGLLVMSVAALIWAANFFLAVLSLHWRALWLLLGLPLVALPFVGAIIGASQL